MENEWHVIYLDFFNKHIWKFKLELLGISNKSENAGVFLSKCSEVTCFAKER